MPKWKCIVLIGANALSALLFGIAIHLWMWWDDTISSWLLPRVGWGFAAAYMFTYRSYQSVAYFRGLRDNGLSRIAEGLWDNSVIVQTEACLVLSMLAGNRFGVFGAHSIALWRSWWTSTKGNLVWDVLTSRFVEAVVLLKTDDCLSLDTTIENTSL